MATSWAAAREQDAEGRGWDAGAAAAALRAYLGAHTTVQVMEAGQRIARLSAEHSGYSISTASRHLVCHFWSPDANLVRRVVGVQAVGANRLRLTCLRMGKSQPTPLVLESGPKIEEADPSREAREEFRLAVMAAARRDWAGWSYEPMADGVAAAHSGTQRLLYRRQQSLLPCVAVGEQESAGVVEGALAQALLWAAKAQSRWPQAVVAAVRLILPEGGEAGIGQRRRWLVGPPRGPAIECWRLDRSAGNLNPVALSDCGNVESRLRRAAGPVEAVAPALGTAAAALLAEMRETCPQTTLETGPDGRLLFRLYGLEIARQATGVEALASPFTFGYGREQSPLLEATRPLFAAFLRDLGEQRVAGQDRRHPLYALQPERWMEHLLRSDLSGLDPQCDRRFVYAQVPVCVPGQRDVLDLLTIDRDGRLLVLELKADEDVGFPLQALDYWLRVRHHQLEGDFERLGYFPGVRLSPRPPRLWMLAPALRWHPQTELLTRWISPEVPWARIGINEEWRHGIQVIYRKEAQHGGE